MKMESAGSCFFSMNDSVTGFNQIRSTSRAQKVHALLTESGCYLPHCLSLGPCNGPEDFVKCVDSTFSLSRFRTARLNKQWKNYVDDFCCRTGRWNDGAPVTDAEFLTDQPDALAPPVRNL